MSNPQYMEDELPEEVHVDGETCICPSCEKAAEESRAEALADAEGRRNWRARTLHGRLVSNCCLAPETETMIADYGLCPKCHEHCEFVREEEVE